MKTAFFILAALLASCTTDVSIMKKIEDEQHDTSISTQNTDTETNDTYDSGPTPDTNDTGLNVDNTLTVGFIEYGFIQASCPYCLGLPTEISSWFYGRFHERTGSNHAAWVPREDEYCREYYESPVTSVNLDIGSSILLSSGAYAYNMTKTYDSTGVVYQSPTYTTDSNYTRDTSLSVSIDGQSLTSETFESLHGFDYVEPYTMLYTDPSYAYAAQINKTTNSFSWGPSGDIDSFFTVQVSVYSYDGASYYGTVICRGPDIGSITIPGSYFLSYPSGSLVSIHMIRHRMKDLYSDVLLGIIQTHTWWEVIGTGHVQ